jgi:ribonuclease G
MMKRGEDLMVQVAKEAISTKGMKVTMDISLPGRYLIYMPKSEHVGVSKHIEEPAERERLRRIIDEENMTGGMIVRTEAEGADEGELRSEIKYLAKLWDGIAKKFETAQTGTLIHRELGLTFQVARDLLNDNAKIFLIDDREEYKDVKKFVKCLAPELHRAGSALHGQNADLPGLRRGPGTGAYPPTADRSSLRRLHHYPGGRIPLRHRREHGKIHRP